MAWRAPGILSTRNYPAMEFFASHAGAVHQRSPGQSPHPQGDFSPFSPSALRALGLDPGWHPPGCTQGQVGRIFHDLPYLSPSSQGAAGQDGFTLSPGHHPKSHVSIRKGSPVVSSVTPVTAPRRCSVLREVPMAASAQKSTSFGGTGKPPSIPSVQGKGSLMEQPQRWLPA